MSDKKVVVLMGGPSAEREVSLNTGRAVYQALKEKGYDVTGIDLDPSNIVKQLNQTKADIVFNAIHGKFGEDGALQGVLDLLGIPYTGSGLLASAMAMDKLISKRMFITANIPTPRYQEYSIHDNTQYILNDIAKKFSLPLVVKSAAQGSSIGVAIVKNSADLQEAISQAFLFSNNILVEEFIEGKEVTVAILGNEDPVPLPIIEIVPHSGQYDYHSKYTKGATDYIVPADLDQHITEAVHKHALQAFKVLGCRGIARVDIMIGKSGNPYVLEVNTIPGMTATSLVPKAAAAAGISFQDLCEKILILALK